MTKHTSPVQRDRTRIPFRRYALAATGALAASGAASTANAEFFYFDIDDVVAEDGESIFFSLLKGTAGVGSPTDAADLEHNWTTDVIGDNSAWRIGNYLGGYVDSTGADVGPTAFINEYPTNVVEFELEDDPVTGKPRKKTTRKKSTKRTISGGNSGANPPATSVARLDKGFLINENSFFEIDNELDSGTWLGTGQTTGFVGLTMEDPAGGASRFGWIRVTYDGEANRMTLHDFAISESPIAAGQTVVPEPSSLALLALGAAGLGVLRSRNRKRD